MESSISSDLIRGHIDTIILRTISKSDKNSQEIIDDISQKSDGKYELKQATLYSCLKRLENENYIKAYWNDSPDGSGRRRYFHLTEKGLELANKNLNDWSFSRAIIDTLVDFEGNDTNKSYSKIDAVPELGVQKPAIEPVIQQNVQLVTANQETKPQVSSFDALLRNATSEEKVDTKVQVEQVQATKSTQGEYLSSKAKLDELLSRPVVNENQNNVQKDVKTSDEFTQELNFRYILNGLIKSNQREKRLKQSENSEIIDEIQNSKIEETVPSFDLEIQKENSAKSGVSDFDDLIDEYSRTDLKIKVSMKKQKPVSVGILINLVNLISILMTCGLFILERVFFAVKYKAFPLWETIAISVVLVLMLTCFIYKYKTKPKRTIYRYLSSKNVLLSAGIVAFDLMLLTLAVVFLSGADLSNPTTLALSLFYPIVTFTNIFVYFLIRAVLMSNDKFRIKSK